MLYEFNRYSQLVLLITCQRTLRRTVNMNTFTLSGIKLLTDWLLPLIWDCSLTLWNKYASKSVLLCRWRAAAVCNYSDIRACSNLSYVYVDNHHKTAEHAANVYIHCHKRISMWWKFMASQTVWHISLVCGYATKNTDLNVNNNFITFNTMRHFTQWPIFGRRRFQMHLVENIFLINLNITDICHERLSRL